MGRNPPQNQEKKEQIQDGGKAGSNPRWRAPGGQHTVIPQGMIEAKKQKQKKSTLQWIWSPFIDPKFLVLLSYSRCSDNCWKCLTCYAMKIFSYDLTDKGPSLHKFQIGMPLQILKAVKVSNRLIPILISYLFLLMLNCTRQLSDCQRSSTLGTMNPERVSNVNVQWARTKW